MPMLSRRRDLSENLGPFSTGPLSELSLQNFVNSTSICPCFLEEGTFQIIFGPFSTGPFPELSLQNIDTIMGESFQDYS